MQRYANTDLVELADNRPFCLEVSPAAMLNSQQHMAGLVYQNGLPPGHQLPLNEYEGFGPLNLLIDWVSS